MMTELSLNVLDIAQNSVKAGAALIRIGVTFDSPAHRMVLAVADNGRGMSPEQVRNVTDPFFTTRTTRKVGLGVPFFKMAAEMTGGSFDIRSELGKGTEVTAVFDTQSIDCLPLGDMNNTISSLVQMNPGIDFLYEYKVDGGGFVMDTREFRAQLEDVPLDTPEVMEFIRDYLKENTQAVQDGTA